MAGIIEYLCLQCSAMFFSVIYFYNSLVMFVYLLVLVAAFVLLSFGKTELLAGFADETIMSMRYFGHVENPDLKRLTDTWNSWQSNLLCCGYHKDNNTEDWLQAIGSIPITCCRDMYIGCVERALAGTDDIHTQGCEEVFIRGIKDFINGLFVVVLVYSGVMILIILATLCTLCECGREDHEKLSTPV
ncbi:uncharacterized protein LOC117106484 isoform X1 [Anneissia japonica]|uniref:uncharacterized protein LOC117106484 isoform X1 n=2 Tax=Anneissia japonica TaxID=1529436 RepID=UPI001425A165|nr:uncharacterized protein LOC117106484 isoform X1 [Anneissia japonica]